jgi:hypothetical protein
MVASPQPGTSGSPAAALRVQRVPLERLHRDPSNARLHGAGNLDAITASLKRFGQAEPLTGMVIAGNGRMDAMKALARLVSHAGRTRRYCQTKASPSSLDIAT